MAMQISFKIVYVDEVNACIDVLYVTDNEEVNERVSGIPVPVNADGTYVSAQDLVTFLYMQAPMHSLGRKYAAAQKSPLAGILALVNQEFELPSLSVALNDPVAK